MTESSNNITTVIRGISKFDGTPSKYQDWKRAICCTLQLTRPEIYEILNGEQCPREKYRKISKVEQTAAEYAARTPHQSDAGIAEDEGQQGQVEHHEGDPAPEENKQSTEDPQPAEGGADHTEGGAGHTEGGAGRQASQAAEGEESRRERTEPVLLEPVQQSPALDLTAYRRLASGVESPRHEQQKDYATATERLLLNEDDIMRWKKNNAALFSVLYLTTVGAAGSLMTRFESKVVGEYSDGQTAWRFMCDKYENNSSQRRRILMRKLDNSRIRLLYTSPSPRDS